MLIKREGATHDYGWTKDQLKAHVRWQEKRISQLESEGDWYWAEVVFQRPAPEGSKNPCPVALTRVWVPNTEEIEDDTE